MTKTHKQTQITALDTKTRQKLATSNNTLPREDRTVNTCALYMVLLQASIFVFVLHWPISNDRHPVKQMSWSFLHFFAGIFRRKPPRYSIKQCVNWYHLCLAILCGAMSNSVHVNYNWQLNNRVMQIYLPDKLLHSPSQSRAGLIEKQVPTDVQFPFA